VTVEEALFIEVCILEEVWSIFLLTFFFVVNKLENKRRLSECTAYKGHTPGRTKKRKRKG
jgi:hypothetical protein